MEERWFRLLTYWQKSEWRHALSFPFLIGALRTPIGAPLGSEETARPNLGGLLDAVRNHNSDGYYLHIYRCPDLAQLVLRQVSGSPYQSTPIPPSSGGRCVLYTSDGVLPSSSSPFDDLFAAIWNECGQAIQLGHFSCRGHKFCPFNDYELKVIGAALD